MQFQFPPFALEQLSEIIVKRYPQCSVFVFGYRSNEITNSTALFSETIPKPQHHFDLLILTSQTMSLKGVDIANTIAEQSGKSITASVLLHRVSELGTKQNGQLLFFDKVLREAYRMHLDKSAPPYISCNLVAKNDDADAKKYWLKCFAVAQFNIQAAKESPQLDVELCKIALLHTSCIQIALGLIRVFLGYTPNEYNLNHLLTLCGHFTDLPAQLFNEQAQLRYKMLCAPPSMLNHWLELHAKESDFLWLLDACELLLKQSEEIVAKKFETINP